VPPGVTRARIEGPGFDPFDVYAHGGFVVVPTTSRGGIYRARWTDPHVGEAVVPANLTSERESDILPRTSAPIDGLATSPGATTRARPTEAYREWAKWLALAAAIVLALDLLWLTRRPRTSRTASFGAAPGTIR
jgi:hypothetical protein